jgi:hypothetical protein
LARTGNRYHGITLGQYLQRLPGATGNHAKSIPGIYSVLMLLSFCKARRALVTDIVPVTPEYFPVMVGRFAVIIESLHLFPVRYAVIPGLTGDLLGSCPLSARHPRLDRGSLGSGTLIWRSPPTPYAGMTVRMAGM